MKLIQKSIYFFVLLVFFLLCYFPDHTFSYTVTGNPLKYISSCELDFNGDDKIDIAILVETVRDRELIVLINTDKGYNAHLVSINKEDMYLSCHFGDHIKETSAGKGKRKGKIFKTPGTFIQLTQAEGSSVVYFWEKDKFREVWTSD